VNRSAASLRTTGRRPRTALAIPAALLIVVLAGLMFLTGCNVQAGVDTNVNADGSGTVGIRLAADEELQDVLSGVANGVVGGTTGAILGILGDLGGLAGDLGGTLPTSADDLFNLIVGQIPGDWTAERGTDSSGNRWLSLTRAFSSPEELQQILSGRFLTSVIATDQFSLTQDRGFFATKTEFSATADAGSLTSRAQSAAEFTQSVLGEVLTVENRVTLPGTIKDNNADEVSGNTLVWNVGTSGSKEMYASSVIYNGGAIAGIAILGVVVLAALIVALVLILRRRGRKPTPEQPSAVQSPPSEQAAEVAPASAAAAETPAAETPATETPAAEPAETLAETSAPEPAETPEPAAAPEMDQPVAASAMAEPAAPAAIEEPAVTPAPAEPPAATPPPPAPAGPAVAEAPRPIVPIPLRPTKTQATGDDISTVSPEKPDETSEPSTGEGAASS